MKLLVLSDSHGAVQNLRRFLALVGEEQPDCILHLGDHGNDLSGQSLNCPVLAVRGNCDLLAALPLLRQECFGRVETVFCHGHQFHVKSGPDAYLAYAQKSKAALALFGHTHQSLIVQKGGVFLVNPGAAQRLDYPSCARILVSDGKICDVELLRF